VRNRDRACTAAYMSKFIPTFDENRVIAWRSGIALTQGELLADVLRTAERLPSAGFALNLCEDRYNFLVGFGAAVARGQVSLLPHTGALGALAQIAAQYPETHLLYDGPEPPAAVPATAVRCSGGERSTRDSLPNVPLDWPLIHAFTSGTTGTPQAATKTWRALLGGAHQLERRAGDPRTAWQSIVSTVPSGHSYGLEAGIVPTLLNGCAIECGRPLFPADVKAALERVPAPRCLVTTPLHLKALITSPVAYPPISLLMSATAPLSIDLAKHAESRLGARIFEIYGCTESGYVATRWTAQGGDWTMRDDMRLHSLGESYAVAADFLSRDVALADEIDTTDNRTFRLAGRSSDMINIAGKRASLSGMTRTLMDIEGVKDGVILMPDSGDESEVRRVLAVVVAPGVSQEEIRRAFQQRVDPVFVPRRIVLVDALPRNETGKLPLDGVWALVSQASETRG
jgi:acyl-coenzyme A synthetase/AMP-(fatty) acid ligase